MWPYTHEESKWISTGGCEGQAKDSAPVSQATIDHYIAKAHALRAAHYAELGATFRAKLGHALAAPLRRLTVTSSPPTGDVRPAQQVLPDLRTPLTSIRAFSEILRNHPDLTQSQRARYLDIILADSKRLEGSINDFGKLLHGSPSPGKV